MATISSMEKFVEAKNAFVKKYGDDLMMATAKRRGEMLVEAAPLAKFAKLPVERFITALARQYASGLQ
jgi:hypothetical protein